MKVWRLFISALPSSLWMLALFAAMSATSQPSAAGKITGSQAFSAKGVVQSVNRNGLQIVIHNEAISNYMGAMTMAFKVKTTAALAGLKSGDEILFQLHVAETESWVDQIVKTGTASPPPSLSWANAPSVHPVPLLLDYKFTNELGQAVSLDDFRGQALAVTFFYTRCPLPDYCPRLSKNFQEASQMLATMTNAPANWHFISITFDPANDTPEMLKAYGGSYRYDPAHWSFLTGPPDAIAMLASSCGVEYQPDAGTFNHNFRTLIVDASGHLQMIFPTTGDLSDQIVAEMLKAATITNRPVTRHQNE